jgi:hypothetical protein
VGGGRGRKKNDPQNADHSKTAFLSIFDLVARKHSRKPDVF